MKKFSFILALLVLFAGCDNDTKIVEPEVNYSVVQFDLQSGFRNQSVSVYLNSTKYFDAVVSDTVPEYGPEGTFTAEYTKSLYEMVVTTKDNTTNETLTYAATIEIGNHKGYYIGINIENGALKVILQEEAFYYL